MQRTRLAILCGVAALGLAGCDAASNAPAPKKYVSRIMPNVHFRDDVQSNRELASEQMPLEFIDSDGKTVDLASYRGKQQIVLVVVRGFYGSICPYCATQTSRLIANYDKFKALGAEVLLVYPGNKERLDDFLAAAKPDENQSAQIPFPVLLDGDFKAVGQLGIRADQARPSTFVIDKEGRIRFAYVGLSDADRPSIEAVLDQLKAASDGEPDASLQ